MKKSKITMDFKDRQQLKGVYLIYKLAENLHSSIQQQSSFDTARHYWSTLFIQAHFACDLLSNMNWPALWEKDVLEPWPDEMAKQLSPVDRMKEMLGFCYKILENDAPSVFNKILAEKYKNIKDPISVLNTKGLPPSVHKNQANFHDRFEKISRGSVNKDEHAELLFKMIRYIYSVRDNFLRGFAFITIPLDENMQLRFQIYSDVLLAVCELVFKAVEQCSNWRHEDAILAQEPQNFYASRAADESHLRNKPR